MAEEAILTKHDGEVKMSKDFDYLCSKLRNGRYKLSIVRCSEKRTISQNDLMWMWFGCIEDETGTPFDGSVETLTGGVDIPQADIAISEAPQPEKEVKKMKKTKKTKSAA